MIYVNAHTHRLPATGEHAVVNIHKDSVEVPKEGYYSAGIHPWFIRGEHLEEDLLWLSRMQQAPNVVAVGECGLDKLAKAPWEKQMDVFARQLELAKALQKPLIIHNVRAGNELLSIKKHLTSRQQWLMHGYHGSVREAELMVKQGCLFGFGKHLFNPKSKAIEACRFLPVDHILPETDDADVSIKDVINAIAQIRKSDLQEITAQLYNNYFHFFQIPQP